MVVGGGWLVVGSGWCLVGGGGWLVVGWLVVIGGLVLVTRSFANPNLPNLPQYRIIFKDPDPVSKFKKKTFSTYCSKSGASIKYPRI